MAGASKAARLPEKCLEAQKSTEVQECVQNGARKCSKIKARKSAAAKEDVNAQNAGKVPAVTAGDGKITTEIIKGKLPTSLNYSFAQNWGSYPTKDGRYVYEFQDGSGKNRPPIKLAVSGLSQELLDYLAASDRKATNCQRRDKDHACYNAGGEESGKGTGKSTESDIDRFHTTAMDKAAYEQWVHKETWEDRDGDAAFPDELLKTAFVAGENKVNNQKVQMRLQVIKQFIASLPYKQQETLIKNYQMLMTQEEIGAEECISKQAVCNRTTRIEDNLREVFRRLGIAIPTKAELAKEAAETAARWKAVKKAEKECEDEETEIRTISSIVHGKNAEDEKLGSDRYSACEMDDV